MDNQYDHVSPRNRKTIADVMTHEMASKCGKSVKTHKLNVREEKRIDSTRSDKNRMMSKLWRSKQGFLKLQKSKLVEIE
jgi:hypothetical protein